MKKILISTLGLFACASTFAELSDYSLNDKVVGTTITGDYTASELVQANGGSNEFASIVLDGSITINDGTDIITTKAAGGLLGASGEYSVGSSSGTGSSTLSLEKGSTGSFYFDEAVISRKGNLIINIDKDAGGYLNTEKITSQSKNVYLNVYKDYGIRTSAENNCFNISVVDKMNINAYADMSVRVDMRNGSSTNLTVADGAYFIFDGVTKILKNASISDVILNNNLENGVILFNEEMLKSTDVVYDETNNLFNIEIALSSQTETLVFKGAEGVDLSNVVWTNSLVDGYWALTGMQAVPEPAEWAMILGSLALGLAVYKRRK
ncbi:MAG: hypothetical protein IJF70_03620 [Opitutales bacterium]|nr:hypothetical protein [Opitutales bacterium]